MIFYAETHQSTATNTLGDSILSASFHTTPRRGFGFLFLDLTERHATSRPAFARHVDQIGKLFAAYSSTDRQIVA